MRHTTLAVSTLVLAVGLAAPAVGQVNEQVARGATRTRQFCSNHQAMRDALFVKYLVFARGKVALPLRLERRGATDGEMIGQLGKVYNRLTLALEGEKPGQSPAISIGRPGQMLIVRPPPRTPTASLVRASQVNVAQLCELHRLLYHTFVAGKPTYFQTLREKIQTAGPECPATA